MNCGWLVVVVDCFGVNGEDVGDDDEGGLVVWKELEDWILIVVLGSEVVEVLI